MKELNALLLYLQNFVYDRDKEEIRIINSSDADKAAEVYNRAVLSILEEGKDPVLLRTQCDPDREEGSLWRRTSETQWELDIAIDCIRKMSDEDRTYIKEHPWTSEYHFGYAMHIRNEYIHPAHRHHVWMADSVSSEVMQKIFSILIPGYDYRRKECTEYFESFTLQEYYVQYGETQKEVFDEVSRKVLADQGTITVDEALEELRQKLKEKLGKEEFIRIFRKHYLEEAAHKEWETEKRNDFWERTFRYAAILYRLEYNQVRCLMKLGFFHEIRYMSIKSREECRRFIDSELGLKDEYAEFMACCGWEVCNPLTNGLWKELQLHKLDLGYDIQKALEEQGITTLGEISRRSYDELAAIEKIDEEKAEVIRSRMEALGLYLRSMDEVVLE